MAGLVKAKKYDWKDSNMALFGSDTERQVKKESAETEPAWEGAGTEVGLQIWRIVKFQVTHWPKEDYGQFFNGDSYIILNTYTVADSEDLKYDLHFWIGKTSSQDEYGTAAYKTVELDTFLDDKAVQHREVQDHESDLFKSYFKQIQILEGGAETGFRHVEPVEYIPRLLRFSGKGITVTVSEIPKCNWCLSSLKSGDVFIFDKGLEIIQWNGGQSSGMERIKAAQFCQQLEADRGTAKAEVEDEECGAFKVARELPESPEEEDEEEENISNTREKVLLKVSDEDGSLDMDEIKRGDIAMSDLGSDDVYLVDVGYQIFVYVGQNASPNEKRNGMPYAHSYVKEKGIVPFIHLCVVKEGNHGMLESALA